MLAINPKAQTSFSNSLFRHRLVAQLFHVESSCFQGDIERIDYIVCHTVRRHCFKHCFSRSCAARVFVGSFSSTRDSVSLHLDSSTWKASGDGCITR